jgi:hypothetical protein
LPELKISMIRGGEKTAIALSWLTRGDRADDHGVGAGVGEVWQRACGGESALSRGATMYP